MFGVPIVIVPVLVSRSHADFVNNISVILEDIIADDCVLRRSDEVHRGNILYLCPEGVVINQYDSIRIICPFDTASRVVCERGVEYPCGTHCNGS